MFPIRPEITADYTVRLPSLIEAVRILDATPYHPLALRIVSHSLRVNVDAAREVVTAEKAAAQASVEAA